MSRLITICIAILLFSTNSIAQKIRFTDKSNVWNILTYNVVSQGHYPAYYFYDSEKFFYFDSVAVNNGKEYKVFNYQSSGILVREDTIANRIYIKYYSDTNEYLAYDFNLSVGDSIKLIKKSSAQYMNWSTYYVTKIDSTQINGYWHKVLYYNSTPVIEGIGSIQRPFYFNIYPHNPVIKERLVCFQNNGLKPILSPAVDTFDNSSSCADTALNVNDIVNINGTPVIYPQPAYESATIQLPKTINQGTISLFNLTGQKAYEASFNHIEKIILPRPALSGLYLYKISTDDGSTYSGKLIFAD